MGRSVKWPQRVCKQFNVGEFVVLKIAKSIVVNEYGEVISVGSRLDDERTVVGIAIFEDEDGIGFDPLVVCIDDDGFESVESFIPLGGYVPYDADDRDSVVCQTCPHAIEGGGIIREAVALSEVQRRRSAMHFVGKD